MYLSDRCYKYDAAWERSTGIVISVFESHLQLRKTAYIFSDTLAAVRKYKCADKSELLFRACLYLRSKEKKMDRSECVHHLRHRTLFAVSVMMLYIFLISSVLTESAGPPEAKDTGWHRETVYSMDHTDWIELVTVWSAHPVKNTSEVLRNIPGRTLKPVLAVIIGFWSLICCMGIFRIQHCSLVYFRAHAFYFVRFLRDLFSQKAKDGKKRELLSFWVILQS